MQIWSTDSVNNFNLRIIEVCLFYYYYYYFVIKLRALLKCTAFFIFLYKLSCPARSFKCLA